MRRLVLAVAVVLATMSIGGAAVASDVFEAAAGHMPGDPERLHLYAVTTGEDVLIPAVGGPPPGEEVPPAVGDVNIFHETLYRLDRATDQPTGDPIGSSDIHCTFVRVDVEAFSADLMCDAVYTLPRGMITATTKLTFSHDAPPVFAIAITGGTGRYADAGGQILIRELPDAEDDAAIYQMRILHLADEH